ncbi:MAG: hypothetical protein AAB254_03885, partial [candidate division NC10 bacterium]
RAGHFAVKEPHLLAVCLLFLCAVCDLKRWNLKSYTLDAVVECLTNLILDGISADRPAYLTSNDGNLGAAGQGS